jgi:hypothetical protein
LRLKTLKLTIFTGNFEQPRMSLRAEGPLWTSEKGIDFALRKLGMLLQNVKNLTLAFDKPPQEKNSITQYAQTRMTQGLLWCQFYPKITHLTLANLAGCTSEVLRLLKSTATTLDFVTINNYEFNDVIGEEETALQCITRIVLECHHELNLQRLSLEGRFVDVHENVLTCDPKAENGNGVLHQMQAFACKLTEDMPCRWVEGRFEEPTHAVYEVVAASDGKVYEFEWMEDKSWFVDAKQ